MPKEPILEIEAYPHWTKTVTVGARDTHAVRLWFQGEDRSGCVLIDDKLIAQASGSGPGAVMGAMIDAIRKAFLPYPLVGDAKRFQRQALRWFRRAQ